MRRVMKSEVLPKEIPKNGLEICLDCWTRSMRHDDTDLGIQLQKTLKSDGDGYGNEDTGQTRRDNEIATATGAMIRSLPRHLEWAIKKMRGVANVWNFPSLDFGRASMEAKDLLEEKLKRNVATRVLF